MPLSLSDLGKGNAMSLQTIDNLLADPLIQAVMQADHVEAGALKGLLTRVGNRVAADRRAGARPPWMVHMAAPSSFAGVEPRLCGC